MNPGVHRFEGAEDERKEIHAGRGEGELPRSTERMVLSDDEELMKEPARALGLISRIDVLSGTRKGSRGNENNAWTLTRNIGGVSEEGGARGRG